MNPWLILGPTGMILVGVASVIYWWRRSRVPIRYFFIGGLLWAISIAPKFVMDLTVTPALSILMLSSLGLMGALFAIGAYVGLRTGLFECGFTYLAVGRTGLRGASLDEATAFGVGFGATEAIVLGLPSVIQLASFMANPSLIDMIPQEQRALLLEQLSASTWLVLAPILERAFTLFAHVFTALLVFDAVRRSRIQPFVLAFVYKSVLDAAAPYLQWVLGSSGSLLVVYLAELWVVAFGAIGIFGITRTRRNWA